MVGEALAPVVRLGEPVGLDHRPHRPVEHEKPLAQGGGECVGGVGAALQAHAGSFPLVVGSKGQYAGGLT